MYVTHPQGQGKAAYELWQEVRRKLTWLLLVCYSLMLVKPVIPVIADVIAHTINEQQHMMTVHEVNGKFHVHYERKSADGADKTKPVTTAKYQQEECVVAGVQQVIVAAPALYHAMHYGTYLCYYPATGSNEEYIPPRA